MNKLPYRLFSFLLAGSFLLAACGATPTAVPSPGPLLEITQTMQALATNVQATLNAAAPTAMPQPTNTQVPTSTNLPTATQAPTQPPPAPTSPPVTTPIEAPSAASAHVNKNTNCRSGPSTDFPTSYTAMAGTDLTIVSKTPLDNYVVVENPKVSGQVCWLFTQYVDISGNTSNLPVATAPAPPTILTFTLSFYRLESCSGFSPAFRVTNTGNVTLQSYTASAKDRKNNSTQTSSADGFSRRSGCAEAKSISLLDPGQTGYVYADKFNYDPSGNNMIATITVCSHDKQEGKCASQNITFTP